MDQNNLLKELARVSQSVGGRVDFVQGGGGNTSVKLDNSQMAIKASGALLSQVTEKDGYSIVDYVKIKEYLDNCQNLNDDSFAQGVRNFVTKTDKRPSIETGFHALLDTFVIHTHSVYANILTCTTEGKKIASSLFPEALWIPYATPGKDLTLSIKDALERSQNKKQVIFLENHGLIVSAPDAQSVLDLHAEINQRIIDYFGKELLFNATDPFEDLKFMREHILFPDQVVYTLSTPELLKTPAAQETLASYKFILESIQLLGLTPNFLDPKNAKILLDMESEKFRQKVLKK